MRKRKSYDHYDGPHVMNELRQTQDCEYSRPRRRNDLKYVGYWGNGYYRETKSWKDKREKQYRGDSRGERHELVFEGWSWREQWNLERYCRKHDVPFRIEEIRTTERRERVTKTERVKHYQVPVYCYGYEWREGADGKRNLLRIIKHQIGYQWKYREIPLDKPVVTYYNVSVREGWRFIWWSDKDIGIEYILKRTEW